MNTKPNQKITVHQTADGELAIDDQDFIQKLIDLGFRKGRNNSPEDLARILKNVPLEHRQDFLAGFFAR